MTHGARDRVWVATGRGGAGGVRSARRCVGVTQRWCVVVARPVCWGWGGGAAGGGFLVVVAACWPRPVTQQPLRLPQPLPGCYSTGRGGAGQLARLALSSCLDGLTSHQSTRHLPPYPCPAVPHLRPCGRCPGPFVFSWSPPAWTAGVPGDQNGAGTTRHHYHHHYAPRHHGNHPIHPTQSQHPYSAPTATRPAATVHPVTPLAHPWPDTRWPLGNAAAGDAL
ncbi:hypothetical protein E2C01_092652 [Portunus trituberculatus]|uniref:Uncharacterized protein n=1 Tax=Portunus trituberculatus TaxID=210409 RepID=A0A5B7JML2_PORTR|nr:hypothetical protein [Portunus trituberculatus]